MPTDTGVRLEALRVPGPNRAALPDMRRIAFRPAQSSPARTPGVPFRSVWPTSFREGAINASSIPRSF